MLHEILPMKLYNQFCDTKPDEKSVCIAINNNAILLRDSGEVSFPRYEDIKFEVSQYVYLFSIDDTKYFLVDLIGADILGYDFVSINEFRSMKPKFEIFAGMTAYHLYIWYRDNKFCGRCGSKMEHDTKERMVHCNKCNNSVYPKIMPAVIVGVINGDKILVTRYKDRPYRGYALIAGFTEIGETAEETVAREVMEETGVKVKNIRYYKSQPWGIAQDLLLGYFCELDGDDTITIDENELSVGEWISREELDVVNQDVALTNEMLCVFKDGTYLEKSCKRWDNNL